MYSVYPAIIMTFKAKQIANYLLDFARSETQFFDAKEDSFTKQNQNVLLFTVVGNI